MKEVRLIHWNAGEAKSRVRSLRAAGFNALFSPLHSSADLPAIMQNPPDAFVIDLSRLPMQGRDIGLSLRRNKRTRSIPLVFVDGENEKVERVKEVLPDATYTTWGRIRTSLMRAISGPRQELVVPSSNLAGYSGTPLHKKLGIKSDAVTLLVNAPEGFEEALGDLPHGAKVLRKSHMRSDLLIWFVVSLNDLRSLIDRLTSLSERLWIAWPKKTSGVRTDLSATIIREAGLASGLVDYKVCAIDGTWSGLLFAKRKME